MAGLSSTEMREPPHPVFRDWDDAQEIARLNRKIKNLCTVLTELVALADSKEKCEDGTEARADYEKRKEATKQRAKELIVAGANN